MNKEDKRQFFKRNTRSESKSEIAKKEKELGRQLTRKEKNRIIEKNAKKFRNRLIITSIAGVIGLGGIGMYGGYKLGEGKNKNISETNGYIVVNANKNKEDEQNKDISVVYDKDDDRMNVFMNSIRVDQNEIGINESIEEQAEKDVSEMEQNIKFENDKNKNTISNYMKQLYIDEYNKINGTNYSKDSVIFEKNFGDIEETKDKNGNIVMQYTGREGVYSETGIVTAKIRDGKNNIVSCEKGTYHNGNIVPVINPTTDDKKDYNGNEAILKTEKVLSYGIDFEKSLLYPDSYSQDQKNGYKERFINSIIEYRKNKITEKSKESAFDRDSR